MSHRNAATSHLTLARASFGALTGVGPQFLFDKDGTGPGGATPPPAKPADAFKSMREEFTRLQGEANGVIELATRENREIKPEEKAGNEQRFSRMTAIKNTLDEQARFASLALSGNAPADVTVTTPTDATGRSELESGEGKGAKGKLDRDEFSKAMSRWAATGELDRKFATITTATSSGALLPKEIATPVVPTSLNVFREALSLYAMQAMSTDTTHNLTVPVMSATAGGVVAENASAETENAPSLSESIVLNVSTYQSGTAYFSNMVLAANTFDVVQYATTELAYSKELGLESAAVAALIADAAVTQVVTTATTTGFTYANLVDLNRKLPKRYDRMKVIILGADAFAAAEKLVGDDGHPVLVKDPQTEGLVRFNGTPVLRSDYFEGLTANKTIGCVVSLMGFKLRDVTAQTQLARYTQVPAKPNQTGFNLFAYHAYGWAPPAVAKLKTAAA